jgi:hypothetical protein
MQKLRYKDIGNSAAHTAQGRALLNLRLRFSRLLARIIRRSCSNGMWTISRDGKLVCESLCCRLGQPE